MDFPTRQDIKFSQDYQVIAISCVYLCLLYQFQYQYQVRLQKSHTNHVMIHLYIFFNKQFTCYVSHIVQMYIFHKDIISIHMNLHSRVSFSNVGFMI